MSEIKFKQGDKVKITNPEPVVECCRDRTGIIQLIRIFGPEIFCILSEIPDWDFKPHELTKVGEE